MLNQLITLNFFVYNALFLTITILFLFSLFYFFESYKDLVIDYLPEMIYTISFWKFLFLFVSGIIMIVIINYNAFL